MPILHKMKTEYWLKLFSLRVFTNILWIFFHILFYRLVSAFRFQGKLQFLIPKIHHLFLMGPKTLQIHNVWRVESGRVVLALFLGPFYLPFSKAPFQKPARISYSSSQLLPPPPLPSIWGGPDKTKMAFPISHPQSVRSSS